MSFFRNIRNITRGKSSSRDSTPVRNSRPPSIVSTKSGRRDSLESGHDSILNRADTFILDSEHDDKQNNSSNTSTLEKKSKKSKVLSKFSTFTKRKKTPSPDATALEHHPSDNATNTYYNWKTEPGLDYDAQSDPFNFLYEKQSTLKAMQNGNATTTASNSNSNSNSNSSSTETPRTDTNMRRSGIANVAFDSSTYRKSKMPTQLKEQLEQLKTQNTNPELNEEEAAAAAAHEENEADKYKTITLNTFRKSFREKFLQQQKNAPYNPSWFVEVEPPPVQPATKTSENRKNCDSKENRTDLFVYENDNYRPYSRSPVTELLLNNRRPSVKRNETFKMERSNVVEKYAGASHKSETPSIRIEIKNSITPNMPSRILPVGVAKPMPSQFNINNNDNNDTDFYHNTDPKKSQARINVIKSPLANWSKPITVVPARNMTNTHQQGRYQTLVQIRNDATTKLHTPTAAMMQPSYSMMTSPSTQNRHMTRIQFGGTSPTAQKRINSTGTRYTIGNPLATTTNSSANLKGYEILRNTTTQQQRPSTAIKSKATYFGDNYHTTTRIGAANPTSVGTPAQHSRGVINRLYGLNSYSGNTTPADNKLQNMRKNSTTTATATATGGSGYNSRRDQQQTQLQYQQQRVLVPMQRRSRSPIKMPWR